MLNPLALPSPEEFHNISPFKSQTKFKSKINFILLNSPKQRIPLATKKWKEKCGKFKLSSTTSEVCFCIYVVVSEVSIYMHTLYVGLAGLRQDQLNTSIAAATATLCVALGNCTSTASTQCGRRKWSKKLKADTTHKTRFQSGKSGKNGT